MAVKFRRKKGMSDEMSTASMSDIAFLLLIFFLVTTIFAEEQGLPLVLPGQASDTAQIKQKNLLNIEIASNNVVTLDGTVFPIMAIETEVRRRIAANDKLVIQMKCDPDSFYGTMVDVLDELRLADARKISVKGIGKGDG